MAGLLTSGEIDAVAAELRLWASTAFVDGESDCALSVLAYVERVTGRQLTPRPRYSGRIGGQLFLKRRGGFPAFAEWAMGQLQCPTIFEPERGDVALCWLPEAGDTACLALGNGMFAARLERGLVIAPMWKKVSWAVRGEPCPRP